MNSRSTYNNEIPEPHPCSIDQKKVSKEHREAFYESIANVCQRHACKLESGYCIKKRRPLSFRISNAN